MSTEKTAAQVVGSVGVLTDDELPRRREHSRTSYKTYREMRTEPTISLARSLVISPLVSTGWSWEKEDAAPEGALELMQETFDNARAFLVKAMLEGCVDFGWQPFELVWEVLPDGSQVPRKFKPLIQDDTDILVYEDTGAYAGLRQRASHGDIDLDQVETLTVAVDVEGTDWYGRAVMETARGPYERALTVDKSSDKYDKKIAGTFTKIGYPVGSSRYKGVDNVDNFDIAKDIGATMLAGGVVCVPRKVMPYADTVDDGTAEAWSVELMSDSSNARAAFIERQRYLDVLKVRAFGLPERAVLEGEFGTKAEAEAHAVFAITNMELRYALLVLQFNWHVVNRVLRFNYGPQYENTVRCVPTPLSDATKAYLRQVYSGVLAHPDVGLVEHDEIDVASIRERVGVPAKAEAELVQPPGPGDKPPVLTPQMLTGLGLAYNPDQPRADDGKFGEGGGG